MSDTSVTTAQAKSLVQGYMSGDNRPQCGNCLMGSDSCPPSQPVCSHGKFAVERQGWCPIWFPDDNWLTEHACVAAKMGIHLGTDLRKGAELAQS